MNSNELHERHLEFIRACGLDPDQVLAEPYPYVDTARRLHYQVILPSVNGEYLTREENVLVPDGVLIPETFPRLWKEVYRK